MKRHKRYMGTAAAASSPYFIRCLLLALTCFGLDHPYAAAARPASWTPEALHAMAALLASHVAQAAAVLGQALPALLAATNISQVVAALGAAAAGEAEKIAHVAGQVRVAFVHQQQVGVKVMTSSCCSCKLPAGYEHLASGPLTIYRMCR